MTDKKNCKISDEPVSQTTQNGAHCLLILINELVSLFGQGKVFLSTKSRESIQFVHPGDVVSSSWWTCSAGSQKKICTLFLPLSHFHLRQNQGAPRRKGSVSLTLSVAQECERQNDYRCGEYILLLLSSILIFYMTLFTHHYRFSWWAVCAPSPTLFRFRKLSSNSFWTTRPTRMPVTRKANPESTFEVFTSRNWVILRFIFLD